MRTAEYPRSVRPSTASTGRRASLALLAWTLLACALASPILADLPDDDRARYEIEATSPARGEYRVTASLIVDAPPRDLARAVADVSSQCERGCAVEVPSIDRTETVHGSFDEGLMATWTVIEDVLDARYWTEVTIREDGPRIEVRMATPTDANLDRWQSAERPHEPFFHHQDGAWTFHYEESVGTRVEYRMTMRSDRFWVNLMPSQVLAGAERHAARLLDHLLSLAEADPGSSDEAAAPSTKKARDPQGSRGPSF